MTILNHTWSFFSCVFSNRNIIITNSHMRFRQPSVKSQMASWCILHPVSRGYCFTRTRLWASVPQRDRFIRTTITKHLPQTLDCSYGGLGRRNEEKAEILDFRAVKAFFVEWTLLTTFGFTKEILEVFYDQVPHWTCWENFKFVLLWRIRSRTDLGSDVHFEGLLSVLVHPQIVSSSRVSKTCITDEKKHFKEYTKMPCKFWNRLLTAGYLYLS